MALIQPTEQRALFGDEADNFTLVKPPAAPRVDGSGSAGDAAAQAR